MAMLLRTLVDLDEIDGVLLKVSPLMTSSYAGGGFSNKIALISFEFFNLF